MEKPRQYVKLCRACGLPSASVYGGRYPRHVCADCKDRQIVAHEPRRIERVITAALRALVYAEANGLCALCEVHCVFRQNSPKDIRPNIAHIDHVWPVCRGGKRERSNLRLLCRKCNMAKGGAAP